MATWRHGALLLEGISATSSAHRTRRKRLFKITGGRRACRLRLRVQLHTIIVRKGDLRLANSKLKLSLNGYFHHLPPLSKLGAPGRVCLGALFQRVTRAVHPALVGPPSRLLRIPAAAAVGLLGLASIYKPRGPWPRHPGNRARVRRRSPTRQTAEPPLRASSR